MTSSAPRGRRLVSHSESHSEDVDCVVSSWGDWGSCSPCGDGGQRTRSRTVTTAKAENGDACPALTETQSCTTTACPPPPPTSMPQPPPSPPPSPPSPPPPPPASSRTLDVRLELVGFAGAFDAAAQAATANVVAEEIAERVSLSAKLDRHRRRGGELRIPREAGGGSAETRKPAGKRLRGVRGDVERRRVVTARRRARRGRGRVSRVARRFGRRGGEQRHLSVRSLRRERRERRRRRLARLAGGVRGGGRDGRALSRRARTKPGTPSSAAAAVGSVTATAVRVTLVAMTQSDASSADAALDFGVSAVENGLRVAVDAGSVAAKLRARGFDVDASPPRRTPTGSTTTRFSSDRRTPSFCATRVATRA